MFSRVRTVRRAVVGLSAVVVWHVMGWHSDIAKKISPSFTSGLGLGIDYYRAASFIRGLVDAEQSHRLAIRVASWSYDTRKFMGLVDTEPTDPILRTSVFNRHFPNPIGLAAGCDKHGEAMQGLLEMGFGFVEVGSVTPLPQPGNPLPRVFRLTEDRAIINRYGFNSDGLDVVHNRLRMAFNKRPGIIGLNLGKNKLSENAASDYIQGVQKLANLCDYLVVNVSSPNTPGLRALQSKAELSKLLSAVKDARNRAVPTPSAGPPLLLKIAPDLTDQDAIDIADVCREVGIDGLIVSNTTIARPDTLKSSHKAETGGYIRHYAFGS